MSKPSYNKLVRHKNIVFDNDIEYEKILVEFQADVDKTKMEYCYNEYNVIIGNNAKEILHRPDPNHKRRTSILDIAYRRYVDLYDEQNIKIDNDIKNRLYDRCTRALILKYSKDCNPLILKLQILNMCCSCQQCPIFLFTRCIFDAFRIYCSIVL